MSIRITCDGCGRKKLIQSDFHILNLQYPYKKESGALTKHLCSSCKDKIVKFISEIEPYKEIAEEPNLVNVDSYRSQLILKAGSVDICKVISLRKAGWIIQEICKEIDLDKSDIITDICRYYDKTKDEFKDCRKRYRNDSYDYEDDESKEHSTMPRQPEAIEQSEYEKSIKQMIMEFHSSRRMRTPVKLLVDTVFSSIQPDAKVQLIADRYSISVSSLIRWRDDFIQYAKSLGVDL